MILYVIEGSRPINFVFSKIDVGRLFCTMYIRMRFCFKLPLSLTSFVPILHKFLEKY